MQQIHWPFRTKPGSHGFAPEVMVPLCLPETWNAMEGLYASGQARAIGVSNFSTKKLQDLLTHAKVPPAVVQVECHPVWQQPALHNFCKSTGIHLTVYFRKLYLTTLIVWEIVQAKTCFFMSLMQFLFSGLFSSGISRVMDKGGSLEGTNTD